MSKHIVCIGAALVDELYYATNDILHATTNNATVQQNAGGVSRNIAHQLGLLGVPVKLISVIGEDDGGKMIKTLMTSAGVDMSACIPAKSTGKYTGIINADGSLFTAFITNSSLHLISPEYLQQHLPILKSAAYLLADTNLSVATMQWLIGFSNEYGVPFIIEPVSVPPAKKLAKMNLDGLFMITPNEDELPAICSAAALTIDDQVTELLGRGVQYIWLHAGAAGSSFFSNEKTISLGARPVEITDCTGAGDGSLSGFILGKWLGKNDLESMQIAHTLAAEILQVKGAIHSGITQEILLEKAAASYP